MENKEVQIIERLKNELGNEENRKNALRRTELISYMNYSAKEILKNGCYLQKVGRKFEDFEISIIKEISDEMGCSLIKYDSEIHIYIDKEPNKEKIKESVLHQYFTEIKNDLLSWPVFSFIICCGVIFILSLVMGNKNLESFALLIFSGFNNIPGWTLTFLILFFIFSFMPAIRIIVHSLIFRKKYLVEEDRLYIFKK